MLRIIYFIFKIYLFIYLFMAVPGLSFSSRGAQASHCGCFSCCGPRALGCAGISSLGSQAIERRLSSCGSWA